MGRLASAFQRAVESHWRALAHLEAARQAAPAAVIVPPTVPAPAAIPATPGGPAPAASPTQAAIPSQSTNPERVSGIPAPVSGVPAPVSGVPAPPAGAPASPAIPEPPTVPLRELTDQLASAARAIAPGWLGEDLTTTLDAPLGTVSSLDEPVIVRLGEARVPGAGGFAALVPLLGGFHLVSDADARDPAMAGLLRCLVFRLAAAMPAGSLRVLATDSAALGATFLPLRGLVEAGVMSAPAASEDDARRVLDEAGAHAQRALAGRGDDSWLLIVAASVPGTRTELARLAALTHAGAAARVCLIVAGWPEPVAGGLVEPPPALGAATRVWVRGGSARIGDPPGSPFGANGRGLAAPVMVDDAVPAPLAAKVAARLGERLREESALRFADLIPGELWTGSSIDGLRTTIGRAGRAEVELAFDDVTPHWLIGGRTGAGKTVFLLDVLYGLAARYPPDELALYLLDFKEGVSFTEFTPTPRDPSFIPHARAVGVESDREYGVAVLRELSREMNRRAAALKRNAATSLAQLRRGGADIAMPRVVAVIDEFQVLFERNDRLAAEATGLLEELARKGRSYGIHLVLASQTVSGVEALYGKNDSIFGQFPLRVALPGGSGVLDVLNSAAEGLALGGAVINDSAGLAGADRTVRFPDAHADRDAVTEIRHRMWERRAPGAAPPSVFEGYATQHVEDDPTFQALAPGGRRPLALVGRVLDVPRSTASFTLDATPGRHLAIVGTSALGADVLHAATRSVARQHAPDTARFLVAPLVAAADEVADETMAGLRSAGHPVTVLDAHGLREAVHELAGQSAPVREGRTYLVVFGVDAAGAVLAARDPETYLSGLDDLRTMLRGGPASGVHLLGWWRGLRRLADDIGGTGNREDVSCLVALNVPGQELGMYLNEVDLAYQPRPNRALLVDRDEQRTTLLVPFVRPGRVVEEL